MVKPLLEEFDPAGRHKVCDVVRVSLGSDKTFAVLWVARPMPSDAFQPLIVSRPTALDKPNAALGPFQNTEKFPPPHSRPRHRTRHRIGSERHSDSG